MNKIKNILSGAAAALVMAGVTGCHYLDVYPPESADYEDTMQNEEDVLKFLYTSMRGVEADGTFPLGQGAPESSADEVIWPQSWNYAPGKVAWGTVSAADAPGQWVTLYNYIGYTNDFIRLLGELSPQGVTDDMKKQYLAEAEFFKAYYHFRLLELYGPVPVIDVKPGSDITKGELPGRYHFDYVVDYIVKKLDESAAVLPAKRAENTELGRPTSVICKALKARVLLYAASPLWNGSFPVKNWRNTNFETPGYGKELVSYTYDETKWDRALTACQEALSAATSAGYALFDVEAANRAATNDNLELPFVPGMEDVDEATPQGLANKAFRERVRMLQYLTTLDEGRGNTELIWGVRTGTSGGGQSENVNERAPARCVRRSNSTWNGGWSGCAPYLYSTEHFYTSRGVLPENDPEFYEKAEWFTRYTSSGTSPAFTTNSMDESDINVDIVKFNYDREPRYYAWIAFDGGEYLQGMNGGESLWLNFKNPNTNGYRSENERNHTGTGFLTKKGIDPNTNFKKDGSVTGRAVRQPFIRMAELYLNLAECYAAKNQTAQALENLNVIRKRAGIKELTTADISSDMSLTDWIRNDRYVELFGEGHRYFDVRRWCIAPEKLKSGTRMALNGWADTPTFEVFNTVVPINQPFKWDNSLYLLPVSNDEKYKNPQLVQAPGY